MTANPSTGRSPQAGAGGKHTGRTGESIEIAIVGAGPRGMSVLERLCANERASSRHSSVTVHVVDPAPSGAGAVWRWDQSRHLMTNTVASQITIYTDDSARIDGPIEPGPSLYDWAQSLATMGPLGGYDEQTRAEARTLGPNSYPTRTFYGRYMHDCFRQIVARAPEWVTVRVHRSRAVAMADTLGDPDGPQGIRLEDGTRLNHLDAVVLALGHVPSRLAPQEARVASLARIHHLTYIAPANPADVRLDGIRPGEPVLLRGLGLNFFDYLALFTYGRGGQFIRRSGLLTYRPSGDEPALFGFSRRGIPYHARGENEKGPFGRHYPRLLTTEVVSRLRSRVTPLHFRRELWPLISREVESVYYGALLAGEGRAAERDEFVTRYLGTPDRSGVESLLNRYGVPARDRWDWDRIATPYRGRRFADRAEFRTWLLGYLADDVAAAHEGNVSGPLKAALDVLRDLRNEVRMAVDHGGLDGDSHRDDLDGWYTPLNAYLSVGPPASRIEEMAALVRAGVLALTGPGTQVRFDATDPGFVAHSAVVPGAPIRSRVLIEARLADGGLPRTADPLLRHLLDTEQCRPHRIPTSTGGTYETGGLDVTGRPNRLLDGRGRAHPRRFAYGVPTEGVHWVTFAGIRPGVDSVTVGDSDAIARAVLALSRVGRVGNPPARERRVGAPEAAVDADAEAGAAVGAGVIV